MGNWIRKKNGTKVRESIKQRISKLVDKVVNREANMTEKGWKALVIVGMWASVALMSAITQEVNNEAVGAVATASVIIAFIF